MSKVRMCECCGKESAEPWEMCSICGWQDEPGLDLWDSANGNHISLWEARMNWQAVGDINGSIIEFPANIQMLAAVEQVLAEHVPTDDEEELEEYVAMWNNFREYLLTEIDNI